VVRPLAPREPRRVAHEVEDVAEEHEPHRRAGPAGLDPLPQAAELRRAREEGDLRPDIDVDLAAWQWSSLVSLTTLRTAGGDPDAARDFGRMADALLDDWTRR
jgi:hypothetical protein